MFCENCGKEMIENTKSCQFCGAEQTAVVIPAASIPVSAPISSPDDAESVSDASSVPISSAPIAPDATSVPIESIETSMGVHVSESVTADAESAYAAAAPTAVIEREGSASVLPTPNTIPTSNLDTPETGISSLPVKNEAPVQTVPIKKNAAPEFQTVVTIKDDEEKRPPERKYSLKHLVMCLAAAAVMAVTAGVFAGLYFSVILPK